MKRAANLAFLRIPPFPGHRAASLAVPGSTPVDPEALLAALRANRVGGQFWGQRAALPAAIRRIVAACRQIVLDTMLAAADQGTAVLAAPGLRIPAAFPVVAPDSDLWHLAASVSEVWAETGHELGLIAALAQTPLRQFGDRSGDTPLPDPASAVVGAVRTFAYVDPFDQSPLDPLAAVDLLGQWRRLIDGNRRISGVLGVVRWKRSTLDPLLWAGQGRVRHMSAPVAPAAAAGTGTRAATGTATSAAAAVVAVWKSRTRAKSLAALHDAGAELAELEDGFVRSVGLGANCVPPLSIVADMTGIYFDPSSPSDLETILEQEDFGPALCQRASSLRYRLVRDSISKYGANATELIRPDDHRRRVLVTGQVEDDRSILCGGAGITNLSLLQKARELERDAWIIYKPHPDVEAGHRQGRIPDSDVLAHADEIARSSAITSLIDTVDAVHVITSLAGFEALLRGKDVTTHGVPFYAGWGLTRDRAAIPARRTRRRSLDELVAAALIRYPRYVDPVTRLPCSPEVLITRIARGEARVRTPLVWLRELQGRLQRLGRAVGEPRR